MIFGCVSENSLFSLQILFQADEPIHPAPFLCKPGLVSQDLGQKHRPIGMSCNLLNHAYFKVYDLCLATCIHISTYPCMYRYRNMLFICFYAYCFL